MSQSSSFISHCKQGNLVAVKKMLEGNIRKVDKEEGLSWSCDRGHLDIVKCLVEHGVDIHNENNLPLCWASDQGHLEIVKYLVEQGADIHANQDSAFRWAAKNGRLDVVKYLLQQGADIHANNDEAFKQARGYGFFRLLNYLESRLLREKLLAV
jgi:ankyrin repeat protein